LAGVANGADTRVEPGRTTKSDRIIWLVVGLLVIPIGLLFWRFSDPFGSVRYFDFEQCYYATARDVLLGGAGVLKSHFDNGTFMNVPIMAWVLTPLARLSQTSADIIFALISAASILGTLFLLIRRSTSRIGALVCLMFLLNGPLWFCFLIGNSTQIVFLCLVAALVIWKRGSGYPVGLLIGLAAVVKPMFILYGLYFFFKKDWSVVIGGSVVIIGALLGSIVVAGPDVTLYWYQHTVAAFAGKPMPASNVQSIEAFILRLSVGPKGVSDWHPHLLPVWGKVARDIVFAALLVVVGYGFWRGRATPSAVIARHTSPRDRLEFCIVLTFCIVTSTVSWTHYYLLLLLPYTLYFTGQLPLREDRVTRLLIWASLVSCSLPVHLHVFESDLLEGIYYRSVQSIWLFGGLLLLGALVRTAIGSLPTRGGQPAGGSSVSSRAAMPYSRGDSVASADASIALTVRSAS
jgi:hypothetical protein